MFRLQLVGGGKMGEALLAGLLRAQWCAADELAVVERIDARRKELESRFPEVAVIDRVMPSQAALLAVKPGDVADACKELALAGVDRVLSIAAGVTTESIEAVLGGGVAVVRAMPNTPAAVRQGFTVGFAGPGVTAEQKTLADQLLRAVGDAAWVEDEGLIDAVTAVSGGGPAYVFLLVEVMAAAGVAQGLPADLAMRMARATVAGIGALLAASPQDAATLRKNVTSPKGTTERALAVLMDEAAWPDIMKKAIAAATARSRELAG